MAARPYTVPLGGILSDCHWLAAALSMSFICQSQLPWAVSKQASQKASSGIALL